MHRPGSGDRRPRDRASNRLLAALPGETWARWRHQLELVELPLGLVLCEAGSVFEHACFPCTAIVSLLSVTEKGESVETAVIGNEGVVGVELFLGGETTPSRAVVKAAGFGYRLNAQAVEAETNDCSELMHLVLRYIQTLIAQVAQTVVCNRHHAVDQQLCRSLLTSLDRLQGNELYMTHEMIAGLLGVRREAVTEAALKLQRAGLISYSRGRVRVLDRTGLAGQSCECYAVVRQECERLLPHSISA